MSEEMKSQSPEPAHPKTSRCKYCKQEIPRKALKCHHCGEYQNKLRLLVFLPYVISSVILLVSIAQVIFAYIQTQEAHKKNIDASIVLKKAEDAVRIANYASEDVNKASIEAKRMVTEIKNILDGTEQKITELDRSIQDANRAMMELQLLTRFNIVVIRAQADDRDAFDQIRLLGKDASFPYHSIARAIEEKMWYDCEYFYKAFVPDVNISWKEGVDPQKLTLQQLWESYKSGDAKIRFGIIQFMWEKRTDISKKERLQFLVNVFNSDEKSMDVIRLCGHYFKAGTNDNKYGLDYIGHLEWWEKNKETIK